MEGIGPYQMTANLSSAGFLELCSPDCRLAFLKRWIRSHLQECKRVGECAELDGHVLYSLAYRAAAWFLCCKPTTALLAVLQGAAGEA